MTRIPTSSKCRLCHYTFTSFPIYVCEYEHRICESCWLICREQYGSSRNKSHCPICRSHVGFSGIFEPSKNVYLKRIRKDSMPGRPFSLQSLYIEVVVFTKSKVYECREHSQMPIKCLHRNCNLYVAKSQFLKHYKDNHLDVKTEDIVKGSSIQVNLHNNIIEYGKSKCLFILRLYNPEIQPGVDPYKDTCKSTLVNLFYVMMTVPKVSDKRNAFVLFWIYSESTKSYWGSIKLISQKTQKFRVAYCKCVKPHYYENSGEDILDTLNYLLITRGCLKSILYHGTDICVQIKIDI